MNSEQTTQQIIKNLQDFVVNQNEIILNQEKIIAQLNAANTYLLNKLVEERKNAISTQH